MTVLAVRTSTEWGPVRARAVELYAAGTPARAIARELGIPRARVRRFVAVAAGKPKRARGVNRAERG